MSLFCANQSIHREPVLAHAGELCNGCYDRLEKWLREIPERYSLVPSFLLPSADLEENPSGGKHTKRPNAPVPVRLAALDLLDTRLGRKWQGTEPTPDRRGTLGVLLAIANEIREANGSTRRADSTVIHEADTIRGQLAWLCNQEWAPDAYTEIRNLHRELGDAIGEYPRPPVATCTIVHPNRELAEGEKPECGGPIFPARNSSGAFCARCHTEWKPDELAHLGAILKVDTAS